MSYGYRAVPDKRGGVILVPNAELQGVIDRALPHRRRTRDAAIDPDPLDPGTPGSEEYTKHDDFLPGGGERSGGTSSEVRNVLFHYPPCEVGQRIEIERTADGVDVVLVTSTTEHGDTPSGASGGTRDKNVHKLSGIDERLVAQNHANAAFWSGNRVKDATTYKPGTEPDRIKQMNSQNKKFYGVG